MQVLVALGLEPGQVLSRDDLIALCWDGRIVGDNAINRVTSLLRHALAEVAGNAVRLETITKVGFRLVVADDFDAGSSTEVPAASRAPPGAPFGRRTLLAGGAMLAAAGAIGGWTVLRSRPLGPDPRAVVLARRADLLMKSGLLGAPRQAMHNYEQAVAIDPLYAEAWGQLASVYRHSFQGFNEGERSSFPRLVHSAAERALELDPDQPDARLALAVMRPFLGRWHEAERDLRAVLSDHPAHWYGNGQLNLLLMEVGRPRAALPYRTRSLAADGAIAVSNGFLVINLLLANRLHEADAALARAFAEWPTHPALWFIQLRLLLETGRPAAAGAFARDPTRLPDRFPRRYADEAAMLADAIASPDPAAKARATDYLLETMESPESALDGAGALALLGNGDLALQACAACLLGGTFAGRSWPRPGDFDRRSTDMLFYPSILALRDRPAFAALLREVGLEAYWKQSGSQPDFRRG